MYVSSYIFSRRRVVSEVKHTHYTNMNLNMLICWSITIAKSAAYPRLSLGRIALSTNISVKWLWANQNDHFKQ